MPGIVLDSPMVAAPPEAPLCSPILSSSPQSPSSRKPQRPPERLCLRLHAANLPRVKRKHALIRRTFPDCFAVVTSLRHGPIVRHLTAAETGVTTTTAAPLSNDNSDNSRTSNHSVPSTSPPLASTNLNIEGHIWGRTEVIRQNIHPRWIQGIPIDYERGTVLYFYVHIFAVSDVADESELDNSTNSMERMDTIKLDFQKALGAALFEVGDILRTCQNTRVKRLRKGGCIFCRIDEAFGSRADENVRLTFGARNLVAPHSSRRLWKHKRSSSLTSPSGYVILEVSKLSSAGAAKSWVLVHRCSPVDVHSKNIEERNEIDEQLYREENRSGNVLLFDMTIDLNTLCNGMLNLPLRLTILMHGGKEMIGMCETTLSHIMKMADEHAIIRQSGDESSTEFGDEDDASEVVGEDQSSYNVSNESMEHTKSDFFQSAESLDISANGTSQIQDPLPRRRLDELLLQRSVSKAKRVGRLRVCRAKEERDGRSFQASTLSSVKEVVDLASIVSSTSPQHLRMGYNVHEAFRHYMEQKCEMRFSVAIDFTSSNGNPLVPGTLHYQSDSVLNDYEETILALGKAIDAYSQSREYYVWGFGAKFEGTVRHLFQCGPEPKVSGVDGILMAYKSVFQSDLIMSGPTILLQVLQAAGVQAHQQHVTMSSESLSYHVLLIITDGLADEYEETQRKLAVYSTMPLSVVIVGVGQSSDFGRMHQLVQPSVPTSSNSGPLATPRANASFVEFRQHQHDPTALGAAALEHVPAQLCEYMRWRGFV